MQKRSASGKCPSGYEVSARRGLCRKKQSGKLKKNIKLSKNHPEENPHEKNHPNEKWIPFTPFSLTPLKRLKKNIMRDLADLQLTI